MTESRTQTETTFHGNVADERPLVTTEGATRAAGVEPDGSTPWTPPARRDRVRWGPVWAGLVVAVPTFLLLQLATLAVGWWDVGPGAGGNNADWISGVNGLVALFLGGLTASATALWRGLSEGLLHGILVWALTVVTLVFLTLFGGGALFGSLAGALTDVASIQQADVPDVAAGQAADVARSGASWAVLGLGLSVVAAAIGGVLGAKTWPGKEPEADRTGVR
ncbi:permease [Geodermatophilus sp. DSM 44513]|uniref:permease n=1 Tax=Geodermatophilus sp. DSM 44513 TaxID=1528104 RepID=UPI0012818B48|nr:permease [Geodermatophilus sp. DSM 44513]WNV77674.1 permease [Geodermatophilus sp. DSM 44513]